MRSFAVLVLALSAGCGLVEGGGLAETPDSGGSDATFFDVAPQEAGSDTSFPDDAAADVADDVITNLDAGTDAPFDAPIEAGPVLTVTGGTYALYGADAGVCSMNGGAGTTFQLLNQRDASVDLVWVDPNCVELPYGVVAPLGSKTQGTYVNHVWRIRNDGDKKFLAEFVLQSGAASYVVTVH